MKMKLGQNDESELKVKIDFCILYHNWGKNKMFTWNWKNCSTTPYYKGYKLDFPQNQWNKQASINE